MHQLQQALHLLYEYTERVIDDSIHENKLSKRSEKLMDLQKFEDDSLNSYKVIDKDKQIYQIPIDRSKQLLLDEENK